MTYDCRNGHTDAAFPVFAALAAGAEFPNPGIDVDAKGKQTAVLAGGWFWCTEAGSEGLAGVENVVSGYAGGKGSDAKFDLLETDLPR